MVLSILMLILLPWFSKVKRNGLILLTLLVVPIGGTYLFCRLFDIPHFVTSRYLINLLPIFLIGIYQSFDAIESRFKGLRRFLRLKALFVVLFVASNLIILPFYYPAEKQDFKGLVAYLKNELRQGDKIYVISESYMPGILHYFGTYPEDRKYVATPWKDSDNTIGFKISFLYQYREFTIYHSKGCCSQYVEDGSRLWVITPKWMAKQIRDNSPCVFKGYFDGSYLNFSTFPMDASMYLFLWDPKSPNEKGIDLPIE